MTNPLHDEIRNALENAAADLFDWADALCDQVAESWADAGMAGRPRLTPLAEKLYKLSALLDNTAEGIA